MSVPQAKTSSMRLIVTLAITCLVSGAVLAAVYGWMNPMIEARRLERVMSVGLQGIFPDANSFKELTLDELPAGVEEPVYEVYDAAGKTLGIYFTGSSNGYGGPIRMAVGVHPETASLVAVRALEQSETPGLGDKSTQDDFLKQLAGKPLSDAFRSGDDVQGITAATVSSRAVFNGASGMARELLGVLGVEVEVAAVEETEQAEQGAGGVAEPEFAAAVRKKLGEDVAFEPADLWEIHGEDGLVAVAAVGSKQGYAAPIKV